jgi:ATP-binding cassette subfamily B protein
VEFIYAKDDASAVGRSGLSGQLDIPDPQRPSSAGYDPAGKIRRLWQSVVGTVTGLPRVLRLAWQAGPWLTVGLAVATVVSGLVPAATAAVARLLINTVAGSIRDDGRLVVLPMVPGDLRVSVTTAVSALAGAQFAVFALGGLATTVRTIGQQLLQERMTQIVQLQVMSHASELDLAFFEDTDSYDLLRQAQQEAATRPVSMITSAFGLVQNLITVASVITILIMLSPILAVIALLAPVPAFVADARYGMRAFVLSLWASPLRRRMQYFNALVTTDASAKEVQLLGLGPYLVERFRLLGGVYYARQRRQVATRYLAGMAWTTLTTLAGSATYLYVALQAVGGQRSLGDLVLYTAAAASLQTAVSGLFQDCSGMYENNLYLGTLTRLLSTRPAVTAPERPRPLPAVSAGRVEFEHVSFSYPGSDRPALADVSFRLEPGRMLAVVGRNGAGKSTVVKLLCRLYDPEQGRILLDGVDIREYDQVDLRSRIAAMFQDYVTYQATAAENIGLGDVGRIGDDAAIRTASAAAGAHPLIESLDQGYDTPLGKWFDQGTGLSGGQWQKVALARAFMRQTPLLVLDEPTSALDAVSEHELFDRLRELAEGRTTLYISHRFGAVRRADEIILLDDGRIAEAGTHQQLMELGGEYARLFSLQAAAYTDVPA